VEYQEGPLFGGNVDINIEFEIEREIKPQFEYERIEFLTFENERTINVVWEIE